MNIQAVQEATREAVKKKFHGKKYLVSRSPLKYPQHLERDYTRITNAYMRLLNSTIAEYTPEIKALLAEYQRDTPDGGARLDANDKGDWTEFSRMLRRVMERAEADLEKKTAAFDLIRKLNDLENRAHKYSIREWKRVVRQTLGINIFDDYYDGKFFRDNTRQWVLQNVDLITTIPQQTLKRMYNVISGGQYAGKTAAEIGRQIQDAYNVSKSHARFIARDQMAKLNARITQQQQTDAGITKYVWRTVGDGRVRESHRHLNGKRFKYSDPPVVDPKTGRRANPGEDYQCRCVALPVFDIDGLTLPWEAEAKKQTK